jgi:cytidyltransferase-like protein
LRQVPGETEGAYQNINAGSRSVKEIRVVAHVEKLISLVTLGGTFDVLHKGHWFILEEAFNVADRVLIGVTTDEFVESMKKSHLVDCYEKRLKELEKFLKQKGFLERADIVSIDDRFGPTVGGDPLSDEIEGVVVSEETEPGAEEINRIRVREGKKPLLIVVVSMVLADDGKPISSTRIRRQEVDRYGRLIG